MSEETSKVDVEMTDEKGVDEQPVAFADWSAATPEQSANPALEPAHDPSPDVVNLTDHDVPDPARESSGTDESADAPPDERSRLLIGPAPTIAGEDPGEFDQIIGALRADYGDPGEGRILREWLVEMAAWKMYTIRRGVRAERGTWETAIAYSQSRGVFDFGSLYLSLGIIDRVVRPAQADADAAFRQLEKGKKRAEKKWKKNKSTAQPTALDVLDLGPPPQASVHEQADTTTNPPTVIMPKPADDADGGAQ
jgi:hypothetical protein